MSFVLRSVEDQISDDDAVAEPVVNFNLELSKYVSRAGVHINHALPLIIDRVCDENPLHTNNWYHPLTGSVRFSLWNSAAMSYVAVNTGVLQLQCNYRVVLCLYVAVFFSTTAELRCAVKYNFTGSEHSGTASMGTNLPQPSRPLLKIMVRRMLTETWTYTASMLRFAFQSEQFTVVWNFINKLSNPISDELEPLRPFTHIYVVCCDENMSRDRHLLREVLSHEAEAVYKRKDAHAFSSQRTPLHRGMYAS
ncbi:hypothetical protein GQ600_20500 [Phytophthora cactorum]|nr:hypothetical protein GQ600_20500 [Phytophthora cactorum]